MPRDLTHGIQDKTKLLRKPLAAPLDGYPSVAWVYFPSPAGKRDGGTRPMRDKTGAIQRLQRHHQQRGSANSGAADRAVTGIKRSLC